MEELNFLFSPTAERSINRLSLLTEIPEELNFLFSQMEILEELTYSCFLPYEKPPFNHSSTTRPVATPVDVSIFMVWPQVSGRPFADPRLTITNILLWVYHMSINPYAAGG